MSLEETQVIDFGGTTKDGGLELVITDSGVTSDPAKRLQLLQEKLRSYATYISSREFETEHPQVRRDRVAIRVMCANPPSDTMAKIRAIGIKGENPVDIPVVYEHSPFGTVTPSLSAKPATPTAKSSWGKLLRRIVTIGLIVAAVIGWKTYNKNKASAEVLRQAVVLVQAFPLYEDNQKYFEDSLKEFHDKAFDGAYKVGGRRSSDSFDAELYHTFLVGLYHRKASEDGRSDIAEALEEHRKALGLQAVGFE